MVLSAARTLLRPPVASSAAYLLPRPPATACALSTLALSTLALSVLALLALALLTLALSTLALSTLALLTLALLTLALSLRQAGTGSGTHVRQRVRTSVSTDHTRPAVPVGRCRRAARRRAQMKRKETKICCFLGGLSF